VLQLSEEALLDFGELGSSSGRSLLGHSAVFNSRGRLFTSPGRLPFCPSSALRRCDSLSSLGRHGPALCSDLPRISAPSPKSIQTAQCCQPLIQLFDSLPCGIPFLAHLHDYFRQVRHGFPRAGNVTAPTLQTSSLRPPRFNSEIKFRSTKETM